MSQYSHSHPFPPRSTAAITDYIMTKKPRPRKLRNTDTRRSKSSSPTKSNTATPPYIEAPPHPGPQTMPQIETFISASSQVETPIIVQPAHQQSLPQPPLYLIHPDAAGPIELPPWVAEFRPRIPPLKAEGRWESPIPKCDTITHAILVREALTKFHLAVYLADEDAGESEERLRQSMAQICFQYMAAMATLGIKKHQIVFFYHGRKQIRMGNLVWDAITEWEEEQWHLRRETRGTRFGPWSRGDDVMVGDGWSYDARNMGQDLNW